MIRAQGLVVELPDADGWKKLPARGRWSGLRHEQSDSELWLRLVEARRTVTLSECRKEARASLSLLHGSGEPDHDRALTSPAEYGGRLGVTLNPDGGGQVEVYGVTVSRCFAALFITGSAAGFPERLQRATNDIFNSFRVPTIGERGQVRRF